MRPPPRRRRGPGPPPRRGRSRDSGRAGPARAGSDPRLVVCDCFSVVTAAAALLCVAVNVVSAAQSFRAGSNIFAGIFQCYAAVFSLFLAVLETEWGFIIRFCKIFKYWSAWGMLQILVAVMTKAYPCIERNDLILLQEIASYMLFACGAFYVILVHTTPIKALPPPPPLVALPEELVEEILLRFPPAEPASLLCASLVCKAWCRLISDPCFRRRYRELYCTPPMLGFLCTTGCEGSWFVPTATFCPPGTGRFDWKVLDAHHGRVLGERYLPEKKESVLVVWDPITDEEWELPFPPQFSLGGAAAVLCAGTAIGACNHLDCHGEPFLVVFVGLDPFKMFVCTYSSNVKAWTEPISTEHPYPVNCDFVDVENHPVLVGNALYFGIWCTNLNLKYNLESGEMSLIQLPSTYEWSYRRCCMLTTTVEGVLGLITVDYSKLIYKLCIWLMKDTPEVDAGWTQSRVIDLKMTVLPHDGLFTSPNVVGVTDGLGTLFMMVESDLYTIDLKTSMVELYQYQDIRIEYVVPYMSIYTPELEAACAGEAPSEGGSSA